MENFIQNISFYAEKKPDHYFVKSDSISYTYEQIVSKIDIFASYLKNKYPQPNKKIGLLCPDNPDFIIAFYAILKAGHIVYLIPDNIFSYNLNTITPKIFFNTLIYSKKHQNHAEQLKQYTDGNFEKVIIGETNSTDQECNFNTILNRNYQKQYFPKISSNKPAVILFSSGSASTPHQVILSRENILENAKSCSNLFNKINDPIIYSTLPIDNFISIVLALTTVLILGGTLIISNPISEQKKIELIKKYKPNVMIGTPKIYKSILKIPELNSDDISSLRMCFSFGHTFSNKYILKWEKKFSSIIMEGYGLAEAPVISVNKSSTNRQEGTIGSALDCNEIKIINSHGVTLHEDQEGELLIRGKNVMLGYYSDKQIQSKDNHGWFHTSDIVKSNLNGSIKFIESQKDYIYRYGYSVSPMEIEKIIITHPKVKDVVAIKLIGEVNNRIKICIVPEPHSNLKQEDIFQFSRENLPKYLYPEFVEFYSEIPRTIFGNVQKFQLSRHLISTNNGG